MIVKIQVRRGLSTEWTSVNPILSSGEFGYETDTGKLKIGNGTTAWIDLEYTMNPEELIILADTVESINTIERRDRTYLLIKSNDGGGLFYYKSSGYDSNGGTVLDAFGGGYWVRDFTGDLEPEMFRAFKNNPGNIPYFNNFLNAEVRQNFPPSESVKRKPKINLVSDQFGSNFHGFPSVVRYNAKDYIFYREGNGHVESTPIGNLAKLTLAIKPVNGNFVESRTVVYQVNGLDPRDPNVLRDNWGNAILVGGVFKVVVFEYLTNYTNPITKVFDFDPTNIAGGLINPITISGIKAVKSDVRLLSDGVTYCFVGYDTSGNCSFVTTTNWTTFNIESIGKGNEAALAQTDDGAIHVIVRGEESFDDPNKVTIHYKKETLAGSWYIVQVLPFTLNAPTLVKTREYISVGVTINEGWLLFGRNKTGRSSLNLAMVPKCDLVCFRSRNNSGLEIDYFTDYITIQNNFISPNVGSTGDAHYCSVVCNKNTGSLSIYTYGDFSHTNISSTSFRNRIYEIRATQNPDYILDVEKTNNENYIKNPEFKQGFYGYESGTNASIIEDTLTGKNVLRLTDVFSPSISSFIKVKKGETIFSKIRMRTISTNLSDGGHFTVRLFNYETGSAVLIDQFNPILSPSIYGGEWTTIVFPPRVAPSSKLYYNIIARSGAIAVSDIEFLEISDNYTVDQSLNYDLETVIVKESLSFPITIGVASQKGTGTYSNNIWPIFSLIKKGSGLPFPAIDLNDIQIIFENCTTQAGSLPVINTNTTISTTGTVTATFVVADGTVGNMSSSVVGTMVVIIRTKKYPFY